MRCPDMWLGDQGLFCTGVTDIHFILLGVSLCYFRSLVGGNASFMSHSGRLEEKMGTTEAGKGWEGKLIFKNR